MHWEHPESVEEGVAHPLIAYNCAMIHARRLGVSSKTVIVLSDQSQSECSQLLLVRYVQLSGIVGEEGHEICIVCKVSFHRFCSADPSLQSVLA